MIAELPARPVAEPVAQLIDPAPLSVPLVGVKLRIRRIDLDVLDGATATVAGTLRSTSAGAPSLVLAGRKVELQRFGRHGWRAFAHTVTGAKGRFVLRYKPHHLLSERVRIVFAGDAHDRGLKRYLGHLRSYRLAGASWYGGGGSLACGGELTSSTMGVANKTLPCGTLVRLRYGGREVSVPVVDRGPYVAGREFDLTEATKRALGFEGVGEVWSTR
jgi:rare lipoprotein A